MRKVLYILTFLPFVFMGTAGKYQSQDIPVDVQSAPLDTNYIKIRAQQMADSAAYCTRKKIDSIYTRIQRYVGHIDTEYRPVKLYDNRIIVSRFEWEWIYKIINKDTLYDTLLIRPIQD